jgi:DNA anti-recombination protein RmuC
MVRDKCKIISNKSQYTLTTSEPSIHTTASHKHPNTHKKHDADLKSYFMKMIETIKEDINNSLKETQEKIGQQVEALKKETSKSLKEIWENTTRQVKELNKGDLKMEVEAIKKI